MILNIKPIIEFIQLRQQYLFWIAILSCVVYFVSRIFPDEFSEQFAVVRPAAFLLSICSFSLWLRLTIAKIWGAVQKRLFVPIGGWVSAKIRRKILRRKLLKLDFNEVVELAMARHNVNPNLHLTPGGPIARNLLSQGIIKRLGQQVQYDASFQVNELAWELVLGMQEFSVKHRGWLAAVHSGTANLERALEKSDDALPILHPTVKSILQNHKKVAD